VHQELGSAQAVQLMEKYKKELEIANLKSSADSQKLNPTEHKELI